MNQGIAFPRTLRALDADGFGASKLGLLLATLLLAAWIWWAFGARVPQFESTSNLRIDSGRVIAYFPPAAMRRISEGEPALIRFDGSTLSSRVQSIASDHVELVLPANSLEPSAASVEIETSRLSPAALALQTLTRGNR